MKKDISILPNGQVGPYFATLLSSKIHAKKEKPHIYALFSNADKQKVQIWHEYHSDPVCTH